LKPVTFGEPIPDFSKTSYLLPCNLMTERRKNRALHGDNCLGLGSSPSSGKIAVKSPLRAGSN